MAADSITFIGGGNMARSLIAGLLRQGAPASAIRVAEPVARTPEQASGSAASPESTDTPVVGWTGLAAPDAPAPRHEDTAATAPTGRRAAGRPAGSDGVRGVVPDDVEVAVVVDDRQRQRVGDARCGAVGAVVGAHRAVSPPSRPCASAPPRRPRRRA